MTNFGYAQSNSLLKREHEASASASSAAAAAATNKRLPRWQLDLADHNGSPQPLTNGQPQQQQHDASSAKRPPSRRNSRVSQAAANAMDIEASAVLPKAAAATTPAREKTLPAKKTSHNAKHETTKKKGRARKPRRVVPEEKEYIPANEQPMQTDVVGGRGGRSNHHPGNRPYWIRILESRAEYTNCRSDADKARIANGILSYVQDELKGRFLNIETKTKRWFILPNPVVMDKIKQALRDKYIPYWARELEIKSKSHAIKTKASAPPKAASTAPAQTMTTNPSVPMQSLLPGNPLAQVHPIPPVNPLASLNGIPSLNFPFGAFPALAAMNASRANSFSIPNMTGATAAARAAATATLNATVNAAAKASAAAAKSPGASAKAGGTKKPKNKLNFLFGASTRRPAGQTAVIPTVDDILKAKIDQMPTFGGAANVIPPADLVAAAMATASAPQIPSIGLSPFQPNLPPSWMASLGLTGLASQSANHGFGLAGNPGAPALPSAAIPSIGLLRSLDMKSLDKYLEQQIKGPNNTTLGGGGPTTAAASHPPSLAMLSSLVGTSFDSAGSSGGSAAAALKEAVAAPIPGKTDWNAMYAKALTNPKAV